MNKYKVGFIGYGNMAKAIAKYLSESECVCCTYSYDVNQSAADTNSKMLSSAQELVSISDYIFLSVKPQAASEALTGLCFNNKTVISIMAGISLNGLQELVPSTGRLVRVMPNLCARIGRSLNAFCAKGLSAEEKGSVKQILSGFGRAVELEEGLFDTITGLTGSSPAYSFRYAKAMTEVGMDNGLSYEQAKELVLYTLQSSAKVLSGANSLEEMSIMIESVCSKGGTTIEGIKILDEGRFDNVIKDAISAAIRRSEELGK